MPPNKGGKNYKRGKNGGKDTGEVPMIDINGDDGQMIGRVLKSVGDRRFTVYCNDNKERLCRLCGTIRKNEWVQAGSLVLIAKRELNTSLSATAVTAATAATPATAASAAKTDNPEENDTFVGAPKEGMLGDILQLIDTRLYGKLKKLPGMNLALFNDVENQDINSVKKKVENGLQGDDDIFDRSSDVSDENDEVESGEDKPPVKKEFTTEGLKDRQKDAAVKRGADREKKEYIRLDDL